MDARRGEPRRRGPRLHYAWITAALGHLNVLSALGLGRFGYTMILPSMKEGLGFTYAETGWLATGNFIGYMIGSPLAGLLASRWPLRRLILTALLGLVTGLAATALVGGLPAALVLRSLTGLASGLVYIPAMTLATVWFAPHRRGMGAGIQTGGAGMGLVLSGLLIPATLQRFGPDGWRQAWLLLALLVAAVWILMLVFLRNRPEDVGEQAYGTSGASPRFSAGLPRWREVFANRGLWALGGIYACFGFSYVVYATFFAAYLVKEGGLSPEAAGRLWGMVGVLSLPSGLLWGALADRIGKLSALAIVFAVHTVSFATFGLARTDPAFLLSATLYGLTAWSIPAIVAAAVADYAPASLTAAGLGFLTIFFGVGQAISPPIAGGIADWRQSFSAAFLLCSGVALVGCLGSLAMRRAERRVP
ncbi:MAG TPA: YbfB/YjiJ family MFS transporter [Candidatus Methylomirabilis sp.]|nr:YbfB/YjiJ family MFS transporter [Candidatus Methylomirabilis sp.]